jgi:hypothetical protein
LLTSSTFARLLRTASLSSTNKILGCVMSILVSRKNECFRV